MFLIPDKFRAFLLMAMILWCASPFAEAYPGLEDDLAIVNSDATDDSFRRAFNRLKAFTAMAQWTGRPLDDTRMTHIVHIHASIVFGRGLRLSRSFQNGGVGQESIYDDIDSLIDDCMRVLQQNILDNAMAWHRYWTYEAKQMESSLDYTVAFYENEFSALLQLPWTSKQLLLLARSKNRVQAFTGISLFVEKFNESGDAQHPDFERFRAEFLRIVHHKDFSLRGIGPEEFVDCLYVFGVDAELGEVFWQSVLNGLAESLQTLNAALNQPTPVDPDEVASMIDLSLEISALYMMMRPFRSHALSERFNPEVMQNVRDLEQKIAVFLRYSIDRSHGDKWAFALGLLRATVDGSLPRSVLDFIPRSAVASNTERFERVFLGLRSRRQAQLRVWAMIYDSAFDPETFLSLAKALKRSHSRTTVPMQEIDACQVLF